MPRQSARPKKANPKYVNGGWDERALAIIREAGSSGSEEEDLGEAKNLPEDESDDDFDASHLMQENPYDGTSIPASEGDHAFRLVESEEFDDNLSYASQDESIIGQETTGQPGYKIRQGDTTHTRGLQDISWKLGKTRQYPAAYGQTLDDLVEVLKARDDWLLFGRDATFPSRATMSMVAESNHEARSSTSQSETAGSDPRPASIPVDLQELQQITEISLEALRATYSMADGPMQQLVLGPWKRERLFDLPYQHALAFGQAWRMGVHRQPLASSEQLSEETPVIFDGVNPDVGLPNSMAHENLQPSFHDGWLVNIGERIQALAWAPQHRENTQYLAIACRPTTRQYEFVAPPNSRTAPGFSPSANYPSCIQIWRFNSKQIKNTKIASLDVDHPPALSLVLGCTVGGIRELKWAPQPSQELTSLHLGTIAIVSTDGCVHVIKVPAPSSSFARPSGLKVERAAITLKPPSGLIFTTFGFASESDVVVGGSDGTVRLFNLTGASSGSPPKPYATLQLHVTYVLTLAPAGTGDLSHFLASGSAAGDLLLTDLRSPFHDRLQLQKTRLPTKNLVYSSHARSWITTVDHSGVSSPLRGSETRVVAHGLRQFFAGHQLSRFPQGVGSATTLASSNKHPFVLVGNTQGTIMCQNVVRRMLPAAANVRSKPWVQKLCQYDWIPRKSGISNNNNEHGHHSVTDPDAMNTTPSTNSESSNPQKRQKHTSLYHGRDTRPGTSRFHEGFKPERQDLSNGITGPTARPKRKKAKAKSKPTPVAETTAATVDDQQGDEIDDQDDEDGLGSEIIFEEEQAVTAIAWNENIETATWAAIGWGSGILRVQDLGHDAGS